MIHHRFPPKQELLPHIAFPSERFFSSFTAQSMLFRRGKNVRGLRLSLLGKGHSRRGRCLHRPVGYVSRAVRKNGHAHTIGPRGAAPERSEKTDTPIPLASGPMWAWAPTKNGRSLAVGASASKEHWKSPLGIFRKSNPLYRQRYRGHFSYFTGLLDRRVTSW